MKNKILILGKGFIGQRLQEKFECDISDKRISSFNEADEEIRKHSPEIIINCIGYTGEKNVDDCEVNKDKTLLANVFVPIYLADIALRRKIKLVHISSGCIYHFNYSLDKPLPLRGTGRAIPMDKPIKEEDKPDFSELFYSRSKIYAEKALMALSDRFELLIPRIRIPLDNRPHPKNVLNKLIKYEKVIDIPNSLTYIPDFVEALKHLIEIKARGIYNVVNKGGLKYSRLLDVYKKYVPGFEYKTIDSNDLNLVRTNLILSVRKLEKTGFKVREIKDVLAECVEGYMESPNQK